MPGTAACGSEGDGSRAISGRCIQFIGGSRLSSITCEALVHAAIGGLRPRFSLALSGSPVHFDRKGVEDRWQASQRMILQLGKACWSLATPAAVTLVSLISNE